MPVRRRFGQHFLHDAAIIGRLLDAIAPRPDERIVEIGPGRGALTWPLLDRAGRLEVIELPQESVRHPGAKPETSAGCLWSGSQAGHGRRRERVDESRHRTRER